MLNSKFIFGQNQSYKKILSHLYSILYLLTTGISHKNGGHIRPVRLRPVRLRPVRLRLTHSSYSVMLNLEIFDISQIRYPRVNG